MKMNALKPQAQGRKRNTWMLVLTALLFAVAMVLSVVEDSLPPLPVAVPGVRFGLSNIAVMYTLFFVGKKQALAVAILKSLFVLSVRGPVAGFISLSGGVLSLAVMMILIWIWKDKLSYLAVSIFGGVFHNIGQFLAVSCIYTSMSLWAYLPVLTAAGIAAGMITATLLRFAMPAFHMLKRWANR